MLGVFGTDTLVGLATGGIYELDGTNRYLSGGHELAFWLVEVVMGGIGNDTFLISGNQTQAWPFTAWMAKLIALSSPITPR